MQENRGEKPLTPDPSEDSDILRRAAELSEALRLLYEARKARNPKFSMSHICRQTGIPSSGYLSDVMSGKRRLAMRYAEPLSRCFKLEGKSGATLQLLVECDHACGEHLQVLRKRLESSQKSLQVVCRPMQDEAGALFFALDVFAAFGLFGNVPTRSQLHRCFGAERAAEVEAALALLRERGFVMEAEDGRFHVARPQVIFHPGDEPALPLRFIRASLDDAAKAVGLHFHDGEKGYFTSQVLSVRESDYKHFLQGLRESLSSSLEQLESPVGDACVRVNLQIYPVLGS